LEEDEGLRVVGNMRNLSHGGFMFVAIHQGKYRINICDRIWDKKEKSYTAGQSEEWREFSSFDEAWKFIKSRAKMPIQAWVY